MKRNEKILLKIKNIKKLKARKIWIYRRLLTVSWTKRLNNETIFPRIEHELIKNI